jgi:hypothetical protein
MRDSGIEIDENAPDANPLLDFASDFDDADLNLTPAGSTDWMRAEGIEFVEETASAEVDEFDNPLAWLSDDDDSLADAAPPPPVRAAAPPVRQAAPPPTPVEAAALTDDSALQEMLELESLLGSGDFLSATAADTAGMEAPAAPVDWQDMMPDDTPNWQSDDLDDSDLESMDWLSDDELLAADDTDDASSLDFFAEPEAAAPPAAPRDFFAEPAEDDLIEDDALAWLTDDELLAEDTDDASALPPAAAMAASSAYAAFPDEDLDDAEESAMAWLSDDLVAEDDDQPIESEESAMAWLSDDLLDDADLLEEPVSTLPTDMFAADSREFDADDEEDLAPDFLPVDLLAEDEPLEENAMAWLGEDALLEDELLDEAEMAELDAIPFASADDDDIDYLALSDEDAHELAETGLTTARSWLDEDLSDDALLEDLASDEFDGDDLELVDEFAAGLLDESNVPAAATDLPPSISDMTTEWDADDQDVTFAWDKFDDETDDLEAAAQLDDLAFEVTDEDAALLDIEDDAFAWEDTDAALEDEPAWLNSLSQPEDAAESDFTPLTVQTLRLARG